MTARFTLETGKSEPGENGGIVSSFMAGVAFAVGIRLRGKLGHGVVSSPTLQRHSSPGADREEAVGV
jgi:hypothetical protein